MSKNKCILAHRQKSALSLQQRLLVPAPVQSRLYKSVQHTAASQGKRKTNRFPLINCRAFTTGFWTTACLTVNPQLAFPRRLLHQAHGTHSPALFRRKQMANEKTLSSTCYAQVSV